MDADFEWDERKNQHNNKKHGVWFEDAQKAFADPKRIIHKDKKHSKQEKRFFCFGKIEEKILTVRFTYREGKIRIFGAGFWRKGKEQYEKAQTI